MSELISKCCGAELADTIEWLGADYRRTKDGWILVKHICNQCRKPCEVEEIYKPQDTAIYASLRR